MHVQAVLITIIYHFCVVHSCIFYLDLFYQMIGHTQLYLLFGTLLPNDWARIAVSFIWISFTK